MKFKASPRVFAKTSLRRSLVTHHRGELLVADLAIAVEVGLADHFVDLLLAQILAKGLHHLK